MVCQRSPSSEYSAFCTLELSSRTSKAIVSRFGWRLTLVTVITGGVLSMSNAVLSSAPVSAVAGALDGESDATTRSTYRPFGTDDVSQTTISSVRSFFSGFHVVSPSRR
jgi:hypothetical protein